MTNVKDVRKTSKADLRNEFVLVCHNRIRNFNYVVNKKKDANVMEMDTRSFAVKFEVHSKKKQKWTPSTEERGQINLIL
jgi:hypothetical protein